jgi:hypothetical protein
MARNEKILRREKYDFDLQVTSRPTIQILEAAINVRGVWSGFSWLRI